LILPQNYGRDCFKMVIMILENVPVGLRGELSRWMIEPKSGVFIGELTARIRDLLWEKCVSKAREGGIIQVWNTKNEQKFEIRMSGDMTRNLVEIEGLKLIEVTNETQRTKKIVQRL